VVRPVLEFLAFVLLGWVLPQLELGRHEECRDHQSQLVEPELCFELRVVTHPLLGSRYHLVSLEPLLGEVHRRPRRHPLL
jgi:hypothetical protein